MRAPIFRHYKYKLLLAILLLLIAIMSFISNDEKRFMGNASVLHAEDSSGWPKNFGFGRAATPAEISALNISIKPDGRGLPAGSGNVSTGKAIYELKCFVCHGKNGTEGPFAPLVGVMGDTTKAKTIGNYWPYATTLFDYIRRAMPFNQPGSLNNNEVYSLTAYLLYRNKITDQATIINATNLPKIKMPALSLFVNDDRHGGPEIK